MRILVTGGTGYIGGRLVRELEARGHFVRCLARRPEHLRPRVAPSTEIVAGDVLQPETLDAALDGIEAAYYMIHLLGARGDFEEKERHGAENFAQAARRAGLSRLVYLGGLGRGDHLSPHLRSRQETGRILRESGVPTIELRASVVIGSGSLSFELVRALVERLPVMIVPRWVRTRTQPIAIEDVLAYLVQALDRPPGVYEIGGAEPASYLEIMREYARQRGLRRVYLSVPVLSPRLSSLWLWLVTPVHVAAGRKLIEGVRNETVVADHAAREVFNVQPRTLRDAIARALANEDRRAAETRWSDALSATGVQGGYGGARYGSRLVDSRVVHVPHPPERAFAPIRRLGGKTGWYSAAWLWRLRGGIDRLVGGMGLRRGRRDPDELRRGDTVDFWRVEEVVPDSLLRLRAEMRLPGRAWLQFEVEDDGEGGSRIRQTAIFEPRGLAGLLYWYALWPAHALVFRGMLRGLAAAV